MRTIYGVVIVVLVAGVGWLLLQKVSGSPSGKEPQNTGEPGFTFVAADPGPRILLEAEAAKVIAPPAVVRSGDSGPAATASNGKCVYIGPEKWNEKYRNGQVEGTYDKGHEEARHPGFARYTFEVAEGASYALWVRVFWVDDCGNSIDISVNGSRPGALTGSTYGRWLWQSFRDVENERVTLALEAGKTYTLTILNREDDVYFDQILFVPADSPVDPVGIQEP